MAREFDTVLVRFGELSTKGKNRKDFIKKLELNLKRILRDHKELSFRRTHDRIYIELNGTDIVPIKEKLQKVFGISSFSFTKKVETDIETIGQMCLELLEDYPKEATFKIISRRHDKSFPMHSDEINRTIAGQILKNTEHKVDVHHPDVPIQIEVHQHETYITLEKIPGIGGYPTGINGKVLLLLSGGIDSPVAAYELMKRGLEVEAIHYASPPYTSDQAKQKVLDLAKIVSIYQGSMKIHIIPFTDLQLEIYKAAKDPYAITIMRRMMYRIAEKVANKVRALAIGTGESVGQVASQTLESIACINAVIQMPVLRPLVCMDKVEIIDLSKQIGTYETSILPYADCCTIFDPKNPVTKPSIKKAETLETLFDYETMIDEAIEQETIAFVSDEEEVDTFL
ncbi:MAG: tRNA 4-thiouridine(8) synthase ThiI [Solobacterium sp.]|nr:tRNA 4-thiouridine(8) synthase ThiI [Solobacterium sp.]